MIEFGMVNVITALRIYALYGRARRGELLDFGSNTLALVLTRSESPLSHGHPVGIAVDCAYTLGIKGYCSGRLTYCDLEPGGYMRGPASTSRLHRYPIGLCRRLHLMRCPQRCPHLRQKQHLVWYELHAHVRFVRVCAAPPRYPC